MTSRSLAPSTLAVEDAYRRLLIWSALAHLALGSALILTPPRFHRPLPPAPVYIEVVPAAAPEAAAPAKARPKQVVDEAIVIPHTPKEKPEPKRQPEAKPEPKAKPQPKPKAQPKRSLEELMAEIRRKAGSAPTAGVGETRSAVTGVLAGIVDRERARYDRTVRGLLYANWAGAAGFSGRNNQIVRFEVTVGSAGKVLGIRLTHSSGDRFLDESAERAIRKADPFPPPPPGYSKLAIRFDPRERL